MIAMDVAESPFSEMGVAEGVSSFVTLSCVSIVV